MRVLRIFHRLEPLRERIGSCLHFTVTEVVASVTALILESKTRSRGSSWIRASRLRDLPVLRSFLRHFDRLVVLLVSGVSELCKDLSTGDRWVFDTRSSHGYARKSRRCGLIRLPTSLKPDQNPCQNAAAVNAPSRFLPEKRTFSARNRTPIWRGIANVPPTRTTALQNCSSPRAAPYWLRQRNFSYTIWHRVCI